MKVNHCLLDVCKGTIYFLINNMLGQILLTLPCTP